MRSSSATRDESGQVFHTYSTFGRGDEMLDTAYMYLDVTPKGRNETGPQGNLMDWVKHHDRYEDTGTMELGCHCHEAAKQVSPSRRTSESRIHLGSEEKS